MAKKKESNTIDLPSAEIVDNKEKSQFELTVDGFLSYVPYTIEGDSITFRRTEVPDELRGKGIAKQLTIYALTYAKDNRVKVVAICPFISKFIRDHQQWQAYVKM